MKKLLTFGLSIVTAIVTYARPHHHRHCHIPPPPPHRHHHHYHSNWWVAPVIIGSAIATNSIINAYNSPKVIIYDYAPEKRLIRVEVLPDGTRVYYYGY